MTTFESVSELNTYLQEVEDLSRSKFIIYSVDRDFNDKEWAPSHTGRVYWDWTGGSGMPAIPYTGIPFMFIGSKRLVCHQGKDLAISQKRRYAEERTKKTMVDHSVNSQRSLWQNTKKVGCPAAISITKTAVFPNFKVTENRERAKKKASKMLRRALETDPIVWLTRYVVTQPTEHAGHAMGDKEIAETPEAPETPEPAEALEAEPCSISNLPLPPRRRMRKTNLQKRCINLSKQIIDKIYLIDDKSTLESLSQKLNNLLMEVTPLTANEDGIPLHQESKRVRVSAAILKELRQGSTGRRKSRFTGSVGKPSTLRR